MLIQGVRRYYRCGLCRDLELWQVEIIIWTSEWLAVCEIVDEYSGSAAVSSLKLPTIYSEFLFRKHSVLAGWLAHDMFESLMAIQKKFYADVQSAFPSFLPLSSDN